VAVASEPNNSERQSAAERITTGLILRSASGAGQSASVQRVCLRPILSTEPSASMRSSKSSLIMGAS
jgi:hypothetical protein